LDTLLDRLSIERDLRKASERVGVSIRYQDHEEALFDDRDGVPDEADRLQFVLAALISGLARYPKSIRTQLLDEIVLEDVVTVQGVNVGGYADCRNHAIHLSLAGTRGEHIVHHELAHLVYCRDDFPRAHWRSQTGYTETRSATQMIEAMKSGEVPREFGDELLEQGFVSRYATTDCREDFAEMAEEVFLRPDSVDVRAARFPAMAIKRDIVLDYYWGMSDEFEFWP